MQYLESQYIFIYRIKQDRTKAGLTVLLKQNKKSQRYEENFGVRFLRKVRVNLVGIHITLFYFNFIMCFIKTKTACIYYNISIQVYAKYCKYTTLWLTKYIHNFFNDKSESIKVREIKIIITRKGKL